MRHRPGRSPRHHKARRRLVPPNSPAHRLSAHRHRRLKSLGLACPLPPLHQCDPPESAAVGQEPVPARQGRRMRRSRRTPPAWGCAARRRRAGAPPRRASGERGAGRASAGSSHSSHPTPRRELRRAPGVKSTRHEPTVGAPSQRSGSAVAPCPMGPQTLAGRHGSRPVAADWPCTSGPAALSGRFAAGGV
jgi:hypothetical protein